MKVTIITLVLLFGCGCNNNQSTSTLVNDTVHDITNTNSYIDSLSWERIDEYFEYAFVENKSSITDSQTNQIQIVGILDNQGQFTTDNYIGQFSVTEDELFDVKSVEDLVKNNRDKAIIIKINFDFYINQRKDLLEDVFVIPIASLNQEDFSQLIQDLNALEYVTKSTVLNIVDPLNLSGKNDSVVTIRLSVSHPYRIVDSLNSKRNELILDSRIDMAYYNDLLKNMKGQSLIIKLNNAPKR